MAETVARTQPKGNPLPTILLTLLGFSLCGILIFLIYPIGTPEDLAAKRAAERLEIRANVDRQQAKLTSDKPGWVDKQAGTLHLPEETVIDSVIAELSRKPIAPSSMAVDPAAAAIDGAAAPVPAQPTPPAPTTASGAVAVPESAPETVPPAQATLVPSPTPATSPIIQP